MKMRLTAGAAIFLALASTATAGPAPAEPACREIPDAVRASPLASSYQSGGVRLEKQRGASACTTSGEGLSCLLNDPGRVTVSSGGTVKHFKVPLLARAKVTIRGGDITCKVVRA